MIQILLWLAVEKNEAVVVGSSSNVTDKELARTLRSLADSMGENIQVTMIDRSCCLVLKVKVPGSNLLPETTVVCIIFT